MKYEMANRSRPGMIHRAISPFESHPDVFMAAKSGAPAMESIRSFRAGQRAPSLRRRTKRHQRTFPPGCGGNTSAIDSQSRTRRLNIQPEAGWKMRWPRVVGTPQIHSLVGDPTRTRRVVGANGRQPLRRRPPAALAASTETAPPKPEVLPTTIPRPKTRSRPTRSNRKKRPNWPRRTRPPPSPMRPRR